ncbi:hypothetical protein AMS57_02200 [Pseudoalteromonas undina]|uniref:hypothetical protein n=1 Tax=Pseudoalteromonas undina TaxID=43660 RepID=UPI0006BB2CBC|nr:hypothetical protein [Pseudoalteromonas undina]KPH92356.1 hypothetical protein AMS57_02200 [Pseudoalteromonas undina]
MKISNSLELLDWFRDTADIDSDYMVGKLTGISKQTLSSIRTGEREFSERFSLQLLLIAEHPEPLKTLALIEANKAEKKGNTEVAKLWRKSAA